MSLTTVDKIITHCGLEYPIADKVVGYVDEAEDMLRDWIGDTKYDEIEADTSHTYYTKLQKAESLLAFGNALPVLNMEIREHGGLVKSTGFAESMNSLMGKRELDAYGRNLFARAKRLVRKLLLTSGRIERPEYLIRSTS